MMPRAELPVTTDGTIFTLNMARALQHQWLQVHRLAHSGGMIDAIVDGELARAQFFGDFTSLDRLVDLASALLKSNPATPQNHLVAARVDAARHEFASARQKIQQALALGAETVQAKRLSLSIDQATGVNLSNILIERERNVTSGAVSDVAALGTLLAELGEYTAAERVYENGLRRYMDASPMGSAWLCFQLGVLWGETVDDEDSEKAEFWYQMAVDYLPGYVSASVHLAELKIDQGQLECAETLLAEVMASDDPEPHWRMSDLMTALGRDAMAAQERELASVMYSELLDRHFLAFADHAAEFLMERDPERALELALINLENRNTPRSHQLVHDAMSRLGKQQ